MYILGVKERVACAEALDAVALIGTEIAGTGVDDVVGIAETEIYILYIG